MRTPVEFANAVFNTVTDALESGDLADLQKNLRELAEQHAAPPEILVFKVDEDKRMVWGWASVVTEKGQPVVDRQGDVLEIDELQGAVHKFMCDSRVGGRMHWRDKRDNPIPVGKIVDSIVFTSDLQKALGIDLGREGWFVGFKVDDDNTWAKVKKGDLRAFSLGGTGVRVPIKD